MTTLELHNNFILFHEFNYGKEEPLKKWVRKDLEYIGHYHDDWNVLMPVVEKIRSLGIEFTIELRKQGWRIVFFKPDQNLLIDVWGKYGPEIVYTGALQAIQWYNEQTKS